MDLSLLKRQKLFGIELPRIGLITLLLVILFYWFSVLPMGPTFDRIPGTIEDGSFNNYILEHDYRWMIGLEPDLFSPPFFAPHENVLFFSDNHLATAPIYAAFRVIGLDRESAFQTHFLFGAALNFIVAAYTLTRYKLKTIAVVFGAFVYAYALPTLSQESHSQLNYRFAIPLALHFLVSFLQDKRLRQLSLFFLFTVIQFLFSIYLGFFLALFSSVVTVIHLFSQLRSLPNFLKQIHFNKPTKIKPELYSHLFLWVFLGLLVMVNFLLYIQTSRSFNFQKPAWEMEQMLPQVESFFLADYHNWWGPVSANFTSIANYRGEHQLFLGAVPLFILLLRYFWKRERFEDHVAFLYAAGALLTILLVLNLFGVSIYKYIWQLPGVNGIRAVSRVTLILIWPAAYLIGSTVDELLSIQKTPIRLDRLVYVLFFLAMLETANFQHHTYSKEESRHRVSVLRAEVKNALNGEDRYVYYAAPADVQWIRAELDAMIVGQNLGVKVLNGYSSSFPIGYGTPPTCEALAGRIDGYINRQSTPLDPAIEAKLRNVLIVGREDCATQP